MSLSPYICSTDGGRGTEAPECGREAGNAPTLVRNTDGYIDVGGSGTFLVTVDLNEDKVSETVSERFDVPGIKNPVFTQAGERENIASGESLPVLFGKIKKWFADLKAVAFSGSYSDLSNKPEALKNPQALTFTGGVTGSYDGSKAKSVEIPKVPASLPANGGNADTVDEKHASDLQDYNNLTNKPAIVNNATTTGANTVLDGRMGKTLKDAINKLNTVTYGNGTVNTKYLGGESECAYVKCGHICQLSISLYTIYSPIPDEAVYFTGLPSAVRGQKFFYPALPEVGDSVNNGYLYIDEAGKITEYWYMKPWPRKLTKFGFTYICK